MAGPDDWMAALPSFSMLNAPPQPNFFTAGLSSGFHQALGSLGGAAQAVGSITSIPGLESWGKGFAATQGQQAQAASRPDLEASPWSPAGIGYQLAKALPTAVGGIGAAIGAGALGTGLPEVVAGGIGAGAFMFPQMVGGNVEAAKAANHGELSPEDAAKSLALGLPEAAAGAVMPTRLTGQLLKGTSGDLARRLFTGAWTNAAYQAPLAAAQEALTQDAFTPDMSLPDRARGIVDAALGGGVIGGIFGAGVSAIHKAAPTVTDNDLKVATDPLRLPPPAPTTLYGDTTGNVGQSPYAVDQNVRARAGLPPEATNIQPIAEPLQIPAPEKMSPLTQPGSGTYSGTSSEELKNMHTAFLGSSGLSTAEAGQHAEIRDELRRRTPPGLPPGEGNLFTPEQVAARRPDIEALKSQTLDGLPESAAEQPFFQNFNAANEPELLNAVRTELETYDKQPKTDTTAAKKARTPPSWLSDLGKEYGVLDENGKKTSPAEEIDYLRTRQAEQQAILQSAPTSGVVLRKAIDHLRTINGQIAKFDALDELHQQADALKQAAVTPNPSPGAPVIAAPDLTPKPRDVPPVFSKDNRNGLSRTMMASWKSADAIVRGNYSDDIKNAALTQQRSIEATITDPDASFSKQQDVQLRQRAKADLANYVGPDRSLTEGAPKVPEPAVAAEPIPTLPPLSERMSTPFQRIETPDGPFKGLFGPQSGETSIEKATREAGIEPNLGKIEPVPEELPRMTSAATAEKAENRARLQAIHDAETDPARKAIAAKALTDTPAAVRKALARLGPPKDDFLASSARSMQEFGKRQGVAVGPETDWAQPHAADLGGDVVWNNGNKALIRGFNRLGEPLYVPADRTSGLRGSVDIRNSKVSFLSEADKEQMSAVAKKLEAENKRISDAKPDGPFTGATSNVVGTPHADPRMVGFIGGLMRALGLGKVRTLIMHPADARGPVADTIGLNGPYISARTSILSGEDEFGHVRAFGPNGKDFYVHLKPEMQDNLAVETGAHEVGHIVETVYLRNEPKGTQDAIWGAYNKAYMGLHPGTTKQELLQMTRNRETAMASVSADRANDPITTMTRQSLDYFTSFSEWFADQVSRWATSAEQPRTVIDKFFKSVADKLRELLSYVTGKSYLPDPVVRDYLNSLAGRSPEMVQAERDFGGSKIPLAEAQGARTMDETNEAVKSAIGNIEASGVRITKGLMDGTINLKDTAFRTALAFQDRTGLALLNGKILPAAIKYDALEERRGATQSGKDKVVARLYETAKAVDPKMRGNIDQYLRDLQAAHGFLDGSKAWKDHADLHGLPDAQKWEQMHRILAGEYSRIQQGGGRDALEATLSAPQLGGYQRLVSLMQPAIERWRATGAAIGGPQINPDETFRTMMTAHDNPTLAMDFYRNSVNEMRDAIQDHVNTVHADAAKFLQTDPAMAKTLNGSVAELNGLMKHVTKSLTQIDRRTYAPLDHGIGDHFVAGKMIEGSEQAVQDALHKAGFDIGVFKDAETSTIFSRVDSMAQAERLATTFRELEAAGHLEKGGSSTGRPNVSEGMEKAAPKFLQGQIAAIRSLVGSLPNIDDKTAETLKGQMISQLMDLLPDNSMLKSLQPRSYASGFDQGMMTAAFRHAANISRATTSAGMIGDKTRLFEEMRQQVQDAKYNPDLSTQQAAKAQDVAREILLREAQQAWHQPHALTDSLQAMMHTIMIGANPAYLLTVMSQVPTLLHGELAKKYGFGKSLLAMASSFGPALNVMKAVAKSPDWHTVGFREDALRAGNVPEKNIQTIMRLDNGGGLSTYTGQMTDLGANASEKSVFAKNVANALGLYGEMFVRVISGLSAAKLYDERAVSGVSRDDYVKNIVSNSQFNWGPGQASRATGPQGVFGQKSKIMLAFQQFHTKMIEKLYTETRALFGKDGSEAKKEAGRFLATHLIAVTAISGTLGLPLAAAAAGVVDRIAKDLTGRDDIDVQGLYRTWLAHTFGPGVADVIAKGLPRGLGIDLSKLGDQNLLPGSSILTDKRKFEDASKDWFKTLSGSAVGEVGNLYLGYRDIMNGDYMLGAIKMLPEGVKGLAEAYYMTQHGYVNRDGVKLPIQPGALDILKAAVGIDPANLAQYNEATKIRAGLINQQQYREQNISRHLSMGMFDPASADLSHWIQEGAKYQMDHPGMPGPLNDLPRTLMQRVLQTPTAQTFGTPLGIPALNLGVRSSTGFITPNQ